jgi:hypothetical protein
VLHTKTSQLQIRVSPKEKREIQRRARQAGQSVSAWVIDRALAGESREFEQLCSALRGGASSYALAALNDFLSQVSRASFAASVAPAPSGLPTFERAYVASMVEHAAARLGVPCPRWALGTPSLATPYFASELASLRLHLLTHSPPAFRRRNLFIDSSVGDRV